MKADFLTFTKSPTSISVFIVGSLPTPIQSAGEALEQANALAESINIIKNKNWTAVVLQFDKWKSVPQSLLANELSKYEV